MFVAESKSNMSILAYQCKKGCFKNPAAPGENSITIKRIKDIKKVIIIDLMNTSKNGQHQAA